MLPFLLANFRALEPTFLTKQSETFAWLGAAHARAEATLAAAAGRDFDEARFREEMASRLARFGCGEDKIRTRGHELSDCTHTRWQDMEIYTLDRRAQGEGALTRTSLFANQTERALQRLYAQSASPPSDLVHVSCTGYAAPSAAQRLVANRGWGDVTRVFHAYHMGCYAAFPAIRAAAGFLASASSTAPAESRRSDVVHTEMCSMHFNPLVHTPEQLVIETLFADGFIAYSVCESAHWDRRVPALMVLAESEKLLPDSSESMSWLCADAGMAMRLARDVPARIAAALPPFVRELTRRAGLSDEEARGALFAVHPGGPRIIDRVEQVLELGPEQLAMSRHVLLERGNMSSATLPHIWQNILESERVESGRAIVSLAFGPGLTVCGAVMRKEAA